MAALSPLAQSSAVAALLARAIDYAGLYPPASLEMTDALREYEVQRAGPDAWALGRFVLSAGQLDGFVAARTGAAPAGADPWPLAVLSTGDIARDAQLIARVIEQHAPLVRVAAVEAKADSPAAVERLAPLLQLASELYVEIPAQSSLRELLGAIRALGARAKIRTGGVTPDAFPSAPAIVRFMRACVEAGVPFKATAGLHHLVCGDYPLTYEHGSARATMHGFLNVFVAAALARRGVPDDVLVRVLEERSADAFAVKRAGAELSWRDLHLTARELAGMREGGLVSFGSCSFQEPMAELSAARLLE